VCGTVGARTRKGAHLDDIGVMQFTQVLDLPYGRHVQAILELAHLNFLDSDLATRRKLSAWREREGREGVVASTKQASGKHEPR